MGQNKWKLCQSQHLVLIHRLYISQSTACPFSLCSGPWNGWWHSYSPRIGFWGVVLEIERLNDWTARPKHLSKFHQLLAIPICTVQTQNSLKSLKLNFWETELWKLRSAPRNRTDPTILTRPNVVGLWSERWKLHLHADSVPRTTLWLSPLELWEHDAMLSMPGAQTCVFSSCCARLCFFQVPFCDLLSSNYHIFGNWLSVTSLVHTTLPRNSTWKFLVEFGFHVLLLQFFFPQLVPHPWPLSFGLPATGRSLFSRFHLKLHYIQGKKPMLMQQGLLPYHASTHATASLWVSRSPLHF